MTDLMDQATKEALARADTAVTLVPAIELRHSAFPGGVIRRVGYKEAVLVMLEPGSPIDENTQQSFGGESIEVTEPDLSTEPDSAITVTISNVDSQLSTYFYNASQVTEIIYMTFRNVSLNVLTSATDVINSLQYEVRGAVFNQQTIIVTAGATNLANKAFPSITYNPISHPALYA